MKETFSNLKEWIPLLQTLSWITLIVLGTLKYSEKLERILDSIQERIKSGSSFKAGPVELGEDLRGLEKVSAQTSDAKISADGWEDERNKIYQNNNGLFLAHIIKPSKTIGQEYDIFIYLVRHKSKEFSDVEYAEFFFGSYWQNKIFKETNKNGLIGVSTSAYGPFLCTCRVKMKNGKEIKLNRYIDFEMGRILKR